MSVIVNAEYLDLMETRKWNSFSHCVPKIDQKSSILIFQRCTYEQGFCIKSLFLNCKLRSVYRIYFDENINE